MFGKLYTVAEAAELLRAEPRTVTGWLKKGTIRGWKSGRKWIIPESSIEEHFNSSQPDGIEPPDISQLKRADQGLSQTRHINELLRKIRTLREHISYLLYPYEHDRWTRGPDTKVSVPAFNRIEWKSIEQHLADTDVWAAWQEWNDTAKTLLSHETSVIELMVTVGEREFGLPFRTDYAHDVPHLTRQFAASGVAMARRHTDPDEALKDARVDWRDNELKYNSTSSMVVRPGLTEEEALERYATALREVVLSEEAAALKVSFSTHADATHNLEDELDGLKLSHALPGSCWRCPNR